MKRTGRLFLIRHGQVKGYEDFPVYGHTDVDLTETGVMQIERMAERLRLVDIQAIYSSDLKRCVRGSRLIAGYHDVSLHFLPELREMYFGSWEGLTLSEIRDRFPEELKRRQADLVNFRPPGQGESIGRFSKRITDCLLQILAQREGEDFVIVGHGGVNRVILCSALGLELNRMFSLHQDYGCLNIIDYYAESTVVRLVNG